MSLHLFSFSFSWFSFLSFSLIRRRKKSKLFLFVLFFVGLLGEMGGYLSVAPFFLSDFLTSVLAEHVNETTAVIKKNATSRFVQRLLQR